MIIISYLYDTAVFELSNQIGNLSDKFNVLTRIEYDG